MKDKINFHEGHRERLKRRFLDTGFEKMDEHVILELLLFYSIPRKDTNIIAHKLIDRFGSLKEVLNASYLELVNIEGLGGNSAILITMIPQLVNEYLKADNKSLKNKKIDRQLLGRYAANSLTGKTVETIALFCLKNNKIIHDCIISQGNKSSVDFRLNDITRIALLNGCTEVAIAHSHPGNYQEPSAEDFRITRNLRSALLQLSINLYEHYIINNGNFVCMSDFM